MVDVGGFRLDLVCAGSGSPTVILDAPLGASHMAWSLVQPEVAKFARVCSYDRAGYGWSDPGPRPRTCAMAVEELHALLREAGVPPPYVLVGNSIGGANARLFAFRYPKLVAGLILVDPVHEDQLERLPPSARIAASKIRVLNLFRHASRLGLLRFFDVPLGEGSSDKLPPQLRPAARAVGFRTAWVDATYLEMVAARESFDEVRTARRDMPERPLHDLPLIVLTRGEEEEGPPDAEETLKAWTELHWDLARESSQGEQVITPRSGHFIQADQPAAVIEAIRRVVEEVRTNSATQAPQESR